MTLRTIQNKYKKQDPISVVTAYDYPSAVHVRITLDAYDSLVHHMQLPVARHIVSWLMNVIAKSVSATLPRFDAHLQLNIWHA